MTTETSTAAPTRTAAANVPTHLYNRDAVLAQSAGEPEWLAQQRLAAWDVFEQLPMPTDRDRAWKYFDPSRLRLDGRFDGDRDLTAPMPSLGSASERAALLVQVDGETATVEMDEALRAQGVTVSSLAQAVRDHPQLVQAHLASVVPADSGRLVALNAALWSEGVFIHVPRDVEVALPVLVAFVQRHADAVRFPRVLVVLERNAKLTLVEERVGSGDHGGFVDGVTEFVLADGASLQHYAVQRWGSRVQDVTTQRTRLGKDARSTTLTAGIGGALQKWWVEAQIEGAGAESTMLGVFFGTGSQHFDVITIQDHIGPHTTSDLLYKSALDGRSVGAYYGLTRVGPNARGTAANQEDRNLLLSPRAKADADPVLEILTSDVIRCGHGASAGPVDQEQLFYLSCRGLPKPVAEKMLVQGFLNQVLEKIPLSSVRSMVDQAISDKLGA